ncbi:uncharacterized protein LOC115734461 [Rhodamnia argentea]|uniref:Uncharacterized protein LOC115734461 n=1 Tax=Rhodamnia argentea TaxID=178133 RepID=A0A8B8NF82_9MYRT|nr:uncharacterized protein LOC115734461 [Rhodamnia argentea]XP_030521123.2 uncharacterized protein LOC115734461 [Rhodamnia argentea]XP_048136497.1 uncharacterized protein LOC115734461 [Rhodamnia argentea]
MEAQSNQKVIERVVSQKALQMGSSFSCQVCVVGFLCGVCLTTLFLAALTSFGAFGFSRVSLSAISMGISQGNSSSNIINIFTRPDQDFDVKRPERNVDSVPSKEHQDRERVSLLYSAWSALLKEPADGREELRKLGLSRSTVPSAPHLEDCKTNAQVNKRLDSYTENEIFPPWTSWKGLLEMHSASTNDEQLKKFRRREISGGSYPPWITGSDQENYPLTRKVQRDLWIHQHPLNCSDPSVRFLVADWERLPGFGIGAQIAGMCGVLAIALQEKRVLVTNYYNRADHDGCAGSARSSWSCYFLPETSQECRDRALELIGSHDAWKSGIVTGKQNYSSKQMWAGRIPKLWGDPWTSLQPTTEINGSLISRHRKMDRRWWRAQAVRYLMRFQTEYTCGLMNTARQAAFGAEAAKIVLTGLPEKWPQEAMDKPMSDIEKFVWSNHRPWIPRPILSMHVRMGDKACEMKVFGFEEYMRLANRIRKRFPHLSRIWLSTEMQGVIDKSKSHASWNFYYTEVRRQVGNITMAEYEAGLGRETSTNYPLVNFLMASDADFFIGALGSTWCFLIDGMRNTGGKVMAGYLSVNKDRFW